MDLPRSPDRMRYPLLALFKQGTHSVVSMFKTPDGQVRVGRLLLQPSGSREVDLLEGVARQARLLKSLPTHHVVAFDQVVEGAGGTWMLYQFAPGTPLGHYLGQETTVPDAWVHHWMGSMLRGIQALHSQSPPFVVGFLEPFDIIVSKTDLCIVDLGVFERIFPEIAARGLDSHPFVGFIAPERRSSVQATPSSDLFSIGAIAFWLLTGYAPVVGQVGCRNSLSQALRHFRPSLPEPIEVLILDLLNFYPSKRPDSASAALARLQPHCPVPDGEPPPAPPQELMFAAGATRSIDAAEAVAAPPAPPVLATAQEATEEPVPAWQEALEDVWWASRRHPVVVGVLLALLVGLGLVASRPKPQPPPPPPTIIRVVSGQAAVDRGGGRHHDWSYAKDIPAGSVLVVQSGPVQATAGPVQLWIGSGSCLTCIGREGSSLHLGWSCGEVRVTTGSDAHVIIDADSHQLDVAADGEVWMDAKDIHCKKGTAEWRKGDVVSHLTAPADLKRP